MTPEEAEAFWDEYDIPFQYDVAIKGRLSGLTRGSTGSGRDRSTVNHLYTEEAFQDGRLAREEGTYLCSPGETPSFEFTEERYVHKGERYMPPVTCSQCLDFMERWQHGDGIPSEQPDRFEWIQERGRRLDHIRDEDWIAEELRKLWDNPDVYVSDPDSLYSVPEGVREEDYALFRLGVAFGTDYEHHYPRDTHDD